MENTEVAKVFRTDDYDKFKFMKENRAIKEIRKKKIKKSIDNYGYIFNPIIVNEKWEIIDGQGRFEVLKEKGLPVDYIIFSGLGAKECVALNTSVSQWDLKDYIESYMNQDIDDYKYLWYLVNKFNDKGIRISEIVFACIGKTDCNNAIKSGNFKCTEAQMEEARDLLEYLSRFVPAMNVAKKGQNNYMSMAIVFSAKMNLVDRERLAENFNKYINSTIAPAYTSLDSAFRTLNCIYNYHYQKKVHLEIEYEKFQTNQYKWYDKKYGKGSKEEVCNA